MAVKYTDEEISNFLKETKMLPTDYRKRIQLRNKRGHKEKEIDVQGSKGNHFRLILRQSNINHLDFSIILAVCPSDSTQVFRLCRYNGKSHEHTNQIENSTFYTFHIHKATERYQELGMREDTFAESSDQFYDFQSAIKCLLNDCSFEFSSDSQQLTFGEF